jgi:predicted dehydrogenase
MNTKKVLRVGVIGHGNRGSGMLKLLLTFPEIEVVSVCDSYPDRAEAAAVRVFEKRGARPYATTDAIELLDRGDIDAVFLFTAWEYHINLACEAMERGIAVGLEVGGAYAVEDCWKLVDTAERTKTPFMLLENCCFNRTELVVTAMARAGLFGEIVHCAGAYAHDLRSEVAHGNENRHYRLRNYLNRCCENYPTHELGPIARLLNINRGNRMVSLVSVATKAAGLKQYLKDRPQLFEKDPTLVGKEFKQGDIVHTIITCAGGETILLKLDTTLPLVYSREFTVRGTKGYYHIDFTSKYHGVEEEKNEDGYKKIVINDETERYANCIPPSWRNITDEQIEQGHGGMDYILWCELADAIKNGKPMPIDVYDAASWMVISVLAERSIQNGGAPQAIPDFTGGMWTLRPLCDVVPIPIVE